MELEEKIMKKIYVFGSLVMDHTTRTSVVPENEQTVLGESFSVSYGGKGVNQAHMVSKLGLDVKMIGAVGKDEYAKMFIKMMKEEHMDASSIFFKDTATGVSNIILDMEGQNRIIVVPGANNYLTSEDVLSLEDTIEEGNIFLLQNEIPIETIKTIIRLGKRKNQLIVLNPAPYKELDEETLNLVDYLTPNENEAMQLFKLESYDEEAILKAFDKLKTKCLILTLGDKGSLYYNHHKVIRNAPFKVKVVDTVGAGDSFNGGLVYALANDFDEEKTLRYANACGALAIQKEGALMSQPSLTDLELFLEEHK